jgi:hypothetical protein
MDSLRPQHLEGAAERFAKNQTEQAIDTLTETVATAR